MTGPALAGTTVLVTRPAGQAETLCAGIRAAGGEALAWPAVRIVALAPDAPAEHALAAGVPDWLVFISRNAVRHGLSRAPDGPRIAAIGPATAEALRAAGRPPDLTAERPDSEGLLAASELADVAGRRFVIVRGVGGRETLAETLRARGAEVGYEEVYRRECPPCDPAALAGLLERWRRGGIDVYTVTSVEILNNLHDMLGAEGAPLLAGTALVTASGRVVQQAERRGHRAARLLASRPDDEALVEAIAGWRSEAAAARGSGDEPMSQDQPTGPDPGAAQRRDPATLDDAPPPEHADAAPGGDASRAPVAGDEAARRAPGDDDAAPAVETIEVRRGGGLAAFALLVALAGLAGSGWLWWQLRSAAAGGSQDAEFAAVRAEVRGQVDALRRRVDALEALAGETAARPAADSELRPAIDANRSAARELEGQVSDLARRMEALAGEVAAGRAERLVSPPAAPGAVAAPEPERTAWREAEIELLLRVAQRQATLGADTAAAREALAAADRLLEQLDDPALQPVRRQIADDLMALNALPAVDLDGIAFRLGTLQARVDTLPLREGAARGGDGAGAATSEPADEGLERLERKSMEFIGSLVRVRDSAPDDRVFRTPAEAWFLRRNLELELQSARVAVLTGNAAAYRDGLDRAARWTGDYFDAEDAGVQAFREALAELAAKPVTVEPPALGALRVWTETAGMATGE